MAHGPIICLAPAPHRERQRPVYFIAPNTFCRNALAAIGRATDGEHPLAKPCRHEQLTPAANVGIKRCGIVTRDLVEPRVSAQCRLMERLLEEA